MVEFSRRVWLIVESSGCESKCGELDCTVWGSCRGPQGCSLALADGELNAIKEAGGAFGLEGTGDGGLEDTVERALDGLLIGERTKADGGGPARLLPAQLPLVGEAKRSTGEGDGAAGRSVGLGV
jgi:hypothetical protein